MSDISENEQELREQILKLRLEHRSLDEKILAMQAEGTVDQLLLRRLKKQKLALKDRLIACENRLTPDIIA